MSFTASRNRALDKNRAINSRRSAIVNCIQLCSWYDRYAGFHAIFNYYAQTAGLKDKNLSSETIEKIIDELTDLRANHQAIIKEYHKYRTAQKRAGKRAMSNAEQLARRQFYDKAQSVWNKFTTQEYRDSTRLEYEYIQIEHYLKSILKYDWVAFNELDADSQSVSWHKLFEDFKVLIVQANAYDDLDLDKTQSIIQAYRERFSKLPFMGRIYVFVNPHFLGQGFSKIITDLRYAKEKSSGNHSVCECELKYKFKRNPIYKFLSKTGNSFDGYYHYDIYICKICGFKWTSCIVEDSKGENHWEKAPE